MVDIVAYPDNDLGPVGIVDRPLVVIGDDCYYFSVDSTSGVSFFRYTKSTDGGETWASPITIATATGGGGGGIGGCCVYYDRWTKDNTGTKIHLGFARNNVDGFFYTSLDTDGDVLGGTVTIFTAVTNYGAPQRFTCSMCVTEGGNVLIAWTLPIATANQGLARSTTGGGSFTARATPWNADSPAGGVNDVISICPAANTGDLNDANIFFFDESTGDIVLRVYDDSADAILSDVSIEPATGITNPASPFLNSAQRHSDGQSVVVIRDANINVSHNLTVRLINGLSTITNLPDAYTAETDRKGTGMCIDQQTGDIYVGWNDSIIPFTSQRSFIAKLPFGASSFDAPIQNSTTDRDVDDCWLPISIGRAGGIVLAAVHQTSGADTSTFVNPDNSVVISAAGIILVVDGGVEVDIVPFFGGPSLSVVFDMQIESWKHVLTPQPILTNLADFESRAISLNKVNFDIEITGVAVTHHEVHPLTAGQGHVPDSIDLEEAALLFNRGISRGNYAVVRLVLYSDVALTRRYQGVLKNMILFQEGGINLWRFKMLFGVDWNPSQPALREWA